MLTGDRKHYLHWQPALQRPEEYVCGLDDIHQAIHIILRTPRGSDPHRPLFG
ncbi:baseplate protein, partial [Salmonella enterica subsp. enterica serovar Anatum]|nr:baseplate protein [Salmonella enterica subsp. enterica serovar Anatum]